MTNRMRELRSCGSVRAEDSNVLGYSDVSGGSILSLNHFDLELHPFSAAALWRHAGL